MGQKAVHISYKIDSSYKVDCERVTLMPICLFLQVYKNLYDAMLANPKAFERPSWWKEAVQWPEVGSREDQVAPPRSKL